MNIVEEDILPLAFVVNEAEVVEKPVLTVAEKQSTQRVPINWFLLLAGGLFIILFAKRYNMIRIDENGEEVVEKRFVFFSSAIDAIAASEFADVYLEKRFTTAELKKLVLKAAEQFFYTTNCSEEQLEIAKDVLPYIEAI